MRCVLTELELQLFKILASEKFVKIILSRESDEEEKQWMVVINEKNLMNGLHLGF